MRADRSRPFTLIDAMILIAAMAVGLGAGIAYDRFLMARTNARFEPLLDKERRLERLQQEMADRALALAPPLPPGSLPVAEPSKAADEGFLPPLPPLVQLPSPGTAKLIRHVRAQEVVKAAALFLASCTVGLLVLRLRRPRPPVRRLALLPGSAVFVALLFNATLYGGLRFVKLWRGEGDLPSRVGDFIESGTYHFGHNVGTCVVLLWTVLALWRRWRVRGWIEWSGLVLGASWLLIYFGDMFGLEWIAPF